MAGLTLAYVRFDDTRVARTFQNDRASEIGGKDVKQYRYAFNAAVVYKGKTYKAGDTVDLTQEEFHAFPQPHMLKFLGDAKSLDAGRTKVDENLTVLHAEESGMQKSRYVFNTQAVFQGKPYGPGDTVDLSDAEAAALPPRTTLRLGTVESLTVQTRNNVDRPVLVDPAKMKTGSPSAQEAAMGALKFADALCAARGIPGPQRSRQFAHFVEGSPACPVDPVTVSFAEVADARVEEMRLRGRREAGHVLFAEAMKELRARKVASSGF